MKTKTGPRSYCLPPKNYFLRKPPRRTCLFSRTCPWLRYWYSVRRNGGGRGGGEKANRAGGRRRPHTCQLCSARVLLELELGVGIGIVIVIIGVFCSSVVGRIKIS